MQTEPKVLVIGDSITMGYTPYVQELLAGKWRVVRNEGNAGDSDNVRKNLADWLARDSDASVVHFNCGLHDIKTPREGGEHQVPPPRYRENLAEIVARLKQTGKALMWATCTPVIYERHLAKEFDRRQEDVEAYNAAALGIVTSEGIAIDDLHAAVQAAGVGQCLSADGVQMTDRAYKMLGRKVADAILAVFRA